MAHEIDNIVKLAIDAYKGKVEKYSVAQSQEALRQVLIEANGGSSKVDYRAIRDGRANGLFSIVEEILKITIPTSFESDKALSTLVDFRNIPAGDRNEFLVENNDLFVVDEVSAGNQGVRRQRLLGMQSFPIKTTWKMVRIYEELDRVLSGRVDFNAMIDRVAESFKADLNAEVRTLWEGLNALTLGDTMFTTGGTYSEDALLDLIAHVEASANGATATVMGTKKALRNLKYTDAAEIAKEDIYHYGYVGKFHGTDVVEIAQTYKPGTKEFAMSDNVLTVIAGGDKPVKIVYEGDPLIIPRDPAMNADLTQEYVYAEKYGVGLVIANGGIGRYEIA